MDTPAFTAEQLAWLREQPGPVKRLLEAATPAAPPTDAQNAAAYDLLTPELKAVVDLHVAKTAAEAKVAQAMTQVTAVASQVTTVVADAHAVIAAAPEGVDTTALAAAVDAVMVSP